MFLAKTHDKKEVGNNVGWVITYEPRSSGFPTRSDTNRAVQPQKIYYQRLEISALGRRGIILSVKRNTKALISCAVADLRLCFRICKNPVFS